MPSGGRTRRAVSEITGGPSIPGRMSGWRPDVLPGSSDIPDSSQDRWPATAVRRKESVARMTWDGLSYVVTVSFLPFVSLSIVIHDYPIRWIGSFTIILAIFLLWFNI